jgi:secreted trypsin-like serine protease
MNDHGTALQHAFVAGAVAGLLGVLSMVGPPLAQSGPLRGQAISGAATPVASASIVEGADASIAEFPFQVALYNPHAGSPAKGFFCGGVILDATRVATAAHCLIGEGGRRTEPSDIAVLAGSTYLDRSEPGSIRVSVASATIDASYRPFSSDYDVGVLQLARPLWSGAPPAPDGRSTIAPLLPDAARAAALVHPVNGVPIQATVSGWGEANPEPGATFYYPRRLHKARVPLVSNFLCEEAYAAIEQPITPRMLCAGGSPLGGQGRPDSCYGDSGGPLVAADSDAGGGPAEDVLIGLVDFGNGCGQTGYPGVYVRVADSGVAHFLRANPPQASAGNVNRRACLRHVHRERGGHGSRHRYGPRHSSQRHRHTRHPRRPLHGRHRCSNA